MFFQIALGREFFERLAAFDRTSSPGPVLT